MYDQREQVNVASYTVDLTSNSAKLREVGYISVVLCIDIAVASSISSGGPENKELSMGILIQSSHKLNSQFSLKKSGGTGCRNQGQPLRTAFPTINSLTVSRYRDGRAYLLQISGNTNLWWYMNTSSFRG